MTPRRRSALALTLMVAVGAAVRMYNVATFPSLRGFDGYGHFTYIWFMADQWRVPLPTSGWSFFHPPLYYALMAGIWTALAPIDPVVRLSVGTGLIAMLGLVHALAIYAIARRYFPGQHVVHLLAAGLMLFLPVHLYSCGFLGNEGLNSVLCTVSLLVLLWLLQQPSAARGALLGAFLGAAMLTKFTALAVVLGAFATVAVQTVVRRQWRSGTAALMATATVMLLVCGWFYARNVSMYGTPFKMSRDEFLVRHFEDFQSKGRRNIWEYVLFDPVILRRPQWPRGIPLTGDFAAGFPHSALRESVPTGVYTNAWFDGGFGTFLPPVTISNESRHAGQILLTLALVPSMLILVGVWTAVRRLWRDGWDDTLAAMLLTFLAMMALFVQATTTVPMHAAVKATYLTPASLVFAFWLALGADRLGRASRRWLHRAAVECTVLALASVVVFTNGLFVARGWLLDAFTNASAWQNIYGVVYYAAGDTRRARQMFEEAAQSSWHLADENLAYLALRDGRPLEALYHIRTAAQLQPKQSFGTRDDRAYYDRVTQADYANQMAIAYYRLGWLDLAQAAAERAYRADATAPETNYDLAILKLARALRRRGTDNGRLKRALAQSRKLLFDAAVVDPGFFEVQALAGALDALEGNCERGMDTIRTALAPHPGRYREYPVTTGPGNIQAAAIRRRLYIDALPEELQPAHQLARCSAQMARD